MQYLRCLLPIRIFAQAATSQLITIRLVVSQVLRLLCRFEMSKLMLDLTCWQNDFRSSASSLCRSTRMHVVCPWLCRRQHADVSCQELARLSDLIFDWLWNLYGS